MIALQSTPVRGGPSLADEVPALSAAQFQTLALQQLNMLYRVALRLTRDPGAADDLVQETYLRALRSWRSFSLHSYGIRPWLIRILRNLHLNGLERRRLQPRAMDHGNLELSVCASEKPFDDSTDPGLFDHLDQRLARALRGLPRHYQLVLLLWAVDGMSYVQIAAALEVPVGTVMSRLHRARNRLVPRLGALALERRIA